MMLVWCQHGCKFKSASELGEKFMGRNTNPYIWVGVSLLISGGLLLASSYFIFLITWLTALGLAMLILSFILLALGRTIPRLPPEFGSLLVETGTDNIAAIIEELGIRGKAIYLPSSLAGGRPQALIPLNSNSSSPLIKKTLPRRFIVRYGNGSEDAGLLVTTTGTVAVKMLDPMPGPNSAELESALSSLLMGTLGVAGGASVSGNEDQIRVEIRNPYTSGKTTLAHQTLGGPLASVVAAVAAEAWDRPVTITGEGNKAGKYLVELKVLD